MFCDNNEEGASRRGAAADGTGRAHPPLRLFYLSGPPLLAGIEEHEAAGVMVRVFSEAKTVADCFKFRNKIGIDIAVEALRDHRNRNPKRLETVWSFAKVDRATRVIRPYLEAGG